MRISRYSQRDYRRHENDYGRNVSDLNDEELLSIAREMRINFNEYSEEEFISALYEIQDMIYDLFSNERILVALTHQILRKDNSKRYISQR